MTYEEAIAFWFGRINYEVKAAQPGDLKLERMRELLRLLGNPHERFRSIHITGTKGKGSTAAMLDSILRKQCYRTGLFTSPHLEKVEERIQVNGQMIPQAELAMLMDQIANVLPADMTFFEIGTALGFLYFAKCQVDFAIVEVGLGGRFDSTNVILPMVAVITSIGFDHMAQLGNTLEAIAFQKAGIIKPHVPTVCGVTETGPWRVIAEVARDIPSPLTTLDKDFASLDPSIPLKLLGRHQRRNAGIAMEVCKQLRQQGVAISDQAIRDGFANVVWPARIEVVHRQPTVIIDSAHNVPSVIALLESLRDSLNSTGRKRCLFAVSNDKPYAEMLHELSEYFDDFVLTKYASNPRCVPPETLKTFVKKPVSVEHDPFRAFEVMWRSAKSDDLIVIVGSMFLAGDLRSHVICST